MRRRRGKGQAAVALAATALLAAEVEGHAWQHFEVGLGTFGFANGLSAGAGDRLRLHDGSFRTLDVPLMAYGLVISENDLGYATADFSPWHS